MFRQDFTCPALL